MMTDAEVPEFRAEFARVYRDRVLVRRIWYGKAQLRRARTHPKLRGALELELPQLEAEATRRGLDLRGWREHVDPDAPITFGIGVTAKAERVNVEHREPPRAKRRKPDPTPATVSGGAALESLEQQLAASLAALQASA